MLATSMVELDRGGRRVGGVDHGRALERLEGAADRGDHGVAGLEADVAVRGVDGVVAGDVGDGGGAGVEDGLCGGGALAAEDAHEVLLE